MLSKPVLTKAKLTPQQRKLYNLFTKSKGQTWADDWARNLLTGESESETQEKTIHQQVIKPVTQKVTQTVTSNNSSYSGNQATHLQSSPPQNHQVRRQNNSSPSSFTKFTDLSQLSLNDLTLLPHYQTQTSSNVSKTNQTPKHYELIAQEQAERLAERLRASSEAFGKLELRTDKLERLKAFHTRLVRLALSVLSQRVELNSFNTLPLVSFAYAGELMALVFDMGRTSFYDYLKLLKDCGLVSYKGFRTTVEQEKVQRVWCSHSLMSVSLSEGIRAKLTPYDFEVNQRNLTQDINNQHTVYRFLKENKCEQSLNLETDTEKLTFLLTFSLTPNEVLNPSLAYDCSHSETQQHHQPKVEERPFNFVRDLPYLTKHQRPLGVERAALSISSHLNDQHSFKNWCKTLWQMLRTLDQLQVTESDFQTLCHWLEKARLEKRESQNLKRPGALATSYLKNWTHWDQINRLPAYRVSVFKQTQKIAGAAE